MDSSLTNRTSSYLPGNSLMLFHFHLLGDHELAALCPVLEAIVRRRTAVVRHWYQLYAQHFGDRRSLAGSEFVRLFESSLEHSLTALVENNVGKFASDVIALGELLVERRVPLAEAVASLGLFEPSVHAVFPGNPAPSAGTDATLGKLTYVQVILLTTAYFSSPAALTGERIAALDRGAAGLAAERRTRFNGLVGASPRMRELYQRIQAAGQTCGPVLILGESGTGKGLVARAIHESGPRERRSFVALNCAAFPKDLIESELFGYQRDALDRAGGECLGIFRAADGGTVFVDEITQIDAQTQRKLLCAIAGRSVRPVGSMREQAVDVRVIASTKSDPREAIARGTLHPELYQRLRDWVIEIPPLRERRDDIPLLVEHFIARCNQSFDGAVLGIRPEALRAMMEHSWPGNVRELCDAIESAGTLGDAQFISLDDLPSTIEQSVTFTPVKGRQASKRESNAR